MTKASRKRIHKALKGAVPHLATGQDSETGFNTEFICCAITDGAPNLSSRFNDGSEAREMIESRIWPWITLETWLKNQRRVRAKDLTFERIQQHRHAWLQQLIKEFSK